ncbi:hypothetical protein P3X46_017360 [Hevea brasiliensis]|uniref:THH1/TOM1/TOM3 domain-containing protein n=1 Tax=Hevea brasiliensis TaxID=3981 RepID=A0ABQ9M5M8_HEVBR|nr:uncharacterized protein LOC110638045 [Hevea brasiliensis]KAJ9174325.1 hypothetical protein P3X46_017360 [Hevea brasiliensis]
MSFHASSTSHAHATTISNDSFNSLLDSSTLCCISGLLLLSLISLAFVFHLRLKSRNSHHLQRFNSLWTVRFLLVSFITLWALNELFRLSFFRRKYLFPIISSLTLKQQTSFCKFHIVFSLGFYEPGFLITQLFLVNVSIQKKTPRSSWAIAFVLANCFPVLFLQILFVFFSGTQLPLPEFFLTSSVVSKSDDVLLCEYPLMSSIIFGAFGIWYLIGFSLSCFKVVNVVINKGLRLRIYALAFVVLIMLPIQILFLGLSVLWGPEEVLYASIAFLVFGTTLVIAAVGEGILVIKPIVDSLAAGEDALPPCAPRGQTVSEEQQKPRPTLEGTSIQL